jgi:hypothetical protein
MAYAHDVPDVNVTTSLQDARAVNFPHMAPIYPTFARVCRDATRLPSAVSMTRSLPTC